MAYFVGADQIFSSNYTVLTLDLLATKSGGSCLSISTFILENGRLAITANSTARCCEHKQQYYNQYVCVIT